MSCDQVGRVCEWLVGLRRVAVELPVRNGWLSNFADVLGGKPSGKIESAGAVWEFRASAVLMSATRACAHARAIRARFRGGGAAIVASPMRTMATLTGYIRLVHYPSARSGFLLSNFTQESQAPRSRKLSLATLLDKLCRGCGGVGRWVTMGASAPEVVAVCPDGGFGTLW